MDVCVCVCVERERERNFSAQFSRGDLETEGNELRFQAKLQGGFSVSVRCPKGEI